MSGDIFYSEVNPAVQAELNARGLSGKRRQTEDLNFMLGKIANVEVQAYGKSKGTDNYIKLTESILNGARVRSDEYLPGGRNGFLAERPYERRKGDTTIPGVNTSRRIPPYITSVDINVTDHSIGLLNSCTFNITVPNPEQDLEYIESIYCRPGRPVNVTIEYPRSAVLSDSNIIPSSSMVSLAALKIEDKPEQQYLNKSSFQGLIINFSITYQLDMTAVVNVILKGTTNVFTDVTAIVDSAKIKEVKNNTNASGSMSIFKGISDEFNKSIVETDQQTAFNSKTEDTPHGRAYVVKYINKGKEYYGITGKHKSSDIYQFISLGWLINFINRKILSKIENNISNAKPSIILDTKITSTGMILNRSIQSANPYIILLPDRTIFTAKDRQDITSKKEFEVIYSNVYYTDQYFPQTEIDCLSSLLDVNVITDRTTFKKILVENQEESSKAKDIENIMINLTEIESIYKSLEDSTTHLVKLDLFLDKVFKLIKKNTGDFIDLHLVTHPEESTKLILFNVAYKDISKRNTTIEPYSVPMFANHPYGTVVTDFQFSGQLPKDSANLAFAINDLESDTTTSDIAPFLNFMYSSNTLDRTRQLNEQGLTVVIDSAEPIISYDEMQRRYTEKRNQALSKWNAAKQSYQSDPKKQDNIDTMYNALKEWVTYIDQKFKEQYNVKNPIIPFEVSFKLNGINGLKWGDVLTFNALPSRYKRNMVFSIISISHSVTDIGEWTTEIKCIARAKID